MSFEDIVAVLGQAFGTALKVVKDTTVFEVSSGDGGRMENIVESLQTLLVAIRGHDSRNAILVNRVRDVFHHDAAAGNKVPLDKTAALCDKLYEDMSQVLNKERTSLKDVVDKNIEDMGKTDASIEPRTQSNMDDDDMPLNINQLTGFDV